MFYKGRDIVSPIFQALLHLVPYRADEWGVRHHGPIVYRRSPYIYKAWGGPLAKLQDSQGFELYEPFTDKSNENDQCNCEA